MDETCRLWRGEGYVACIDEKQDKRMASESTLFLFTTARSADCIRRLRRRCDWRLFGGNYARWRQEAHKCRRFKGFRRAAPQIGGL